MERRIDGVVVKGKMRTHDLLNLSSRYLAEGGITNSLTEVEVFLGHILNCSRTKLYLENRIIEGKRLAGYWDLLSTRRKGVPLQYLVGSTEFMGIKFKVGPGVFIPRPETEILVEAVLNVLLGKATDTAFNLNFSQLFPLQLRMRQGRGLRILDIGTGCGNIAISIAKYLKKGHIFACDISDYALQLTKENAHLNNVKIYLVKSNLCSAFKKRGYFSLIVSNPPYIKEEEIPGLTRELHYEPSLALKAGKDGLFYYQNLINAAGDYLQDRGLLVLEIGDGQAGLVQEMLRLSQRFSLGNMIRDYNGIDRVIVAQKTRNNG